jgi:hypothetical protein
MLGDDEPGVALATEDHGECTALGDGGDVVALLARHRGGGRRTGGSERLNLDVLQPNHDLLGAREPVLEHALDAGPTDQRRAVLHDDDIDIVRVELGKRIEAPNFIGLPPLLDGGACAGNDLFGRRGTRRRRVGLAAMAGGQDQRDDEDRSVSHARYISR